jgi:eukaryotic-like serine/threonine-protein kinase
MAESPDDGAWVRYLQEHGIATFDQIEAALRVKSRGPVATFADALVHCNVITTAQRDTIARKLLREQQGLSKLGNFQLTRKLGEGGMGAVYLGEDTFAGRQVAIKVLPKKFADNPEFIARFRREARATGKLSHPNIVAAYTFGEDAGQHFYAMEYMAGRPLDSYLKDAAPMPWDAALSAVLQVARGLEYAHRHDLIHRDIKPANIFLTDGGEAKILDLGLSKDIGGSEQSFMTQSGAALGTPHYISPEQARGDKEIDGRTDIYSLGATFYHLVTGRTPFEGSGAGAILLKHLTEELPNPLDINPELPEPLCRVICKMMAKHPDDRYADCAALITDLELLSSGKAPGGAHLEEGKSSVAMRRANLQAAVADAAQRSTGKRERTETGPRTVVLRDEDGARKRTRPKRALPIALIAAAAGVLIVLPLMWSSRATNGAANAPGPAAAEPANAQTPVQPEPVTSSAAVTTPQPTPATQQIQAGQARTVNLLPLIELPRDAVRGTWRREDGALISDTTGDFSQTVGGARVQIPYRPPAEYDLRVRFTRLNGSQCVALIFPAPESSAARGEQLAVIAGGWMNSRVGFELVNGEGSEGGNNSTGRQGQWLRTGERQELILRVRKGGATAVLDGREVTATPANYAAMSTPQWYELRDRSLLGLASWNSSMAFHSVELVEISGEGRELHP